MEHSGFHVRADKEHVYTAIRTMSRGVMGIICTYLQPVDDPPNGNQLGFLQFLHLKRGYQQTSNQRVHMEIKVSNKDNDSLSKFLQAGQNLIAHPNLVSIEEIQELE
ncbi:hypothetical protein GDO81_005356 [Engystomops pustulosus]|uniref:Uncharacterized protein n=1 Tax=Engystomops pustulosus TaxID=76066 RepID=A0AAV7CNI4_ENGPU|nr:hypothetical protein GDO81_005356 [Engystomops pustulosus]